MARSVWFTEPRPGGGQHAGLSRELIVRTAIEVLDEHGLAALSMRKLAAQLGAAPMSLYWHVPTKDALLELALDRVMGELEPPDEGTAWDVAVRGAMVSLRQLGLRHPWCMRLLGKYAGIGPNAVALAEAMLARMRDAGMSVVESSRAASTLSSYVFGFVVAEFSWADAQVGLDVAQVVDKYRDGHPHYVAQMAEAELWDVDHRFGFGLDCVIEGLRARINIAGQRL